MNKKQQILKALSMLQLAYSTDLSVERLEMYVEMLADINPVTLEQAVKNIVKTRKFLPTVAEIREECAALSGYVNAHEDVPTALEAWEKVYRAARSYGYEKGLNQLSGLTKQCAELIWQSFNPINGDDFNETATRSQFIRNYEMQESRERERTRMVNSIKDNHLLLEARKKAEHERALLDAGKKKIEITATGNLIEVVAERKPVDVMKMIENSDISDAGKTLLKRAIGG